MKIIKYLPWLTGLLLSFQILFFPAALSAAKLPSVAFFYGPRIPITELSIFDQVVLEPLHTTPGIIKQLQNQNQKTLVFAYISIGEIEQARSSIYQLDNKLIIGHNTNWNSLIIDQSADLWHQFVLEKLIPPLVKAGFNGLFMDTLDSYQLAVKSKKERSRQLNGQVRLIKKIKAQFPKLKLFANRGFELLPHIAPYLSGIAVESLFKTFDSTTLTQYRDTTAEEQKWLLAQLNKVKQYNIPITIIDYVSADTLNQSKNLVNRIVKHGFTPWISVPSLDILGAGLITPKPRKVLMIYDGNKPIHDHPMHTVMALVVEYLGLVPEYIHVNDGLPCHALTGEYVGIISWLTRITLHQKDFDNWVRRQLDAKLPLLFLNYIPITDAKLLSRMGIKRVKKIPQTPIVITKKSVHSGTFEAAVQIQYRNLPLLKSVAQNHNIWLALKDKAQQTIHPILLANWGGMALSPFVLTNNGTNHKQWQLDPFLLVQKALKLNHFPVPDATTENGRRIMTSHIDGDGFSSRAEMPGTPFSGDVIKKEIITRYKIPHSVSVIEGEIAATGLSPELTTTLEPIAQDIFSLDNVEIASHSYSHPFFWNKNITPEKNLYGYFLPINGYRFNLKREIMASTDYINRKLAPPNKKVKVFFWTGDARPDYQALTLTKKIGLLNINGGNSIITNRYPSITGLYPQGIPTKAGWQIYAPIMNENVYTNNWSGPFYGYKKVIETFKLTDNPRRLKPASMYWHFYSGTKFASLYALQDVYNWVLAQNVLPLYISEYIQKVEGFYSAQLSQNAQGEWLIHNLKGLRTLRVPLELGFPSPQCSDNIAGFIDSPQGRYLHLTGDHARLCFTDKKNDSVYLEQANGQLLHWQYKSTQQVKLRIKGHQNVEFVVISSRTCRLKNTAATVKITTEGERQQFKLNDKDTGHATLVCQI